MALLQEGPRRTTGQPDQSPANAGGPEPKRGGSLLLRGYSAAVIGLSGFADRVRAYREAANDPAVDERRRKVKARLLLAGAAGVGTVVAAAEVAKANGVHVPAVSDVFTGGNFGGKVADCVNQSNPPVEQSGVPTAGAGVPVDVFNACVDQVQKAQSGK